MSEAFIMTSNMDPKTIPDSETIALPLAQPGNYNRQSWRVVASFSYVPKTVTINWTKFTFKGQTFYPGDDSGYLTVQNPFVLSTSQIDVWNQSGSMVISYRLSGREIQVFYNDVRDDIGDKIWNEYGLAGSATATF